MNEKKPAPRTSDADPGDEQTTNDNRSSLERLAEFTRRILGVQKEHIIDVETAQGRPHT